MSELNVTSKPQGKGLAVTGFVLSLVGLIFSSWVAVAAAAQILTGGSPWLMYVWLVLCIVSIVLSVMGMSKLGKTGGKKGLGIAGMIVGIVATIYAIILSLGLGAVDAGVGNTDISAEWEKSMQKLESDNN